MRIEFDPDKDAANVAKHGVSLFFGAAVFGDANVVVIDSDRPEDGEKRHKAIGLVGGRLWTAVYVERDAAFRFISVRKSNGSESRGYHRDPRRFE